MTSGEDKEIETARLNFIASRIRVSNLQYQLTSTYIKEYNAAVHQLEQVSRCLERNFNNDLNISNVEGFLSNITKTLTSNVQPLTVKYSPDIVRNYIISFYQAFLNNLSLNKGAETEIRELNLLYFKKFLNSNATSCIKEFDRNYNSIFSEATSNFSQSVEREVSATYNQLENLRAEIIIETVKVVKTLSDIISNRESARKQFDNFVRNGFYTTMKYLKNFFPI